MPRRGILVAKDPASVEYVAQKIGPKCHCYECVGTDS